MRQRSRRFALEREIGEHVSHERLVDEQLAERRTMPRVVDGLATH
jgi:hypothetical protein